MSAHTGAVFCPCFAVLQIGQQSEIFGKGAAICGILANGIALLLFPTLIFAPAISWIPPTLAAPFRMIWYVLIAIKLLKLGTQTS